MNGVVSEKIIESNNNILTKMPSSYNFQFGFYLIYYKVGWFNLNKKELSK